MDSWPIKLSQNHHAQKQQHQKQEHYHHKVKMEESNIAAGAIEPVENYNLFGHENHMIVADLDGTLTRDPSPFPYFMLVALEAGSPLRGFVLLLFYPLIWLLRTVISASASMSLLIFISTAGLRASDISLVGRAVLCKFYLEDLHSQSYRVFLSCGKRCVVTATPRLMVEHFLRAYLDVENVIATELHTLKGYCTGLVSSSHGVLLGAKKKDAVNESFMDKQADIGLASNSGDCEFFSLCKEAYMVDTKKQVEAVRKEHYLKPLIFHDGRLVMRPTPVATLAMFLWMPFGISLGIIRIMAFLMLPTEIAAPVLAMSGIKVRVKGAPPVQPGKQVLSKLDMELQEQDQQHLEDKQDENLDQDQECDSDSLIENGHHENPLVEDKEEGIVYACSHKTLLDPLFVSGVLRRRVTAVVYSVSKVSEFLSPVTTVRLRRQRSHDGRLLRQLLQQGDIIICPEGTTCREPYLLRFSSLFAEVSTNIVPVALDVHVSMFHGTSARGLKALDPFFFVLNPRPTYFITFLDPVPPQHACIQDARTGINLANLIQRQVAQALGFCCTTLTRKDKYMILAGNDGSCSS